MGKKSLHFKQLRIRKMPGLGDGLAPFGKLSPHINIIAGPNASGKSSTARAIQQIIWQDATAGLQAEGHFDLDGEQWTANIDNSGRHYQKSGEAAQLQVIPTAENKKRYMLSLHDLIQAEEQDLAAQILKDAIGGYDIDEAIRQLHYSGTKSRKNIGEYKEWESAKNEVKKISAEHQKLKGQQNELSRLKEEKMQARKAGTKAEFYVLLAEYFEKERQKDHHKEVLSQFPEVLRENKVKVDDFETLEVLERTIRTTGKTIEDLKKQIKEYREKKQALQLPENGIEGTRLRELNNYVAQLKDSEDAIRECKDAVINEQTLRDEAGNKLGNELALEQFEGVDIKHVDITTEKWQQAFDVSGEIRRIQREIARLEDEQIETPSSKTLDTGIESLAKWLRAVSGEGGNKSHTWYWLTVISAFLTVGAIYYFGVWGFNGLILLVISLIFLYKNLDSTISEEVKTRESDFRETGLEPPSEWKVEAVLLRLKELTDQLQSAKQQEDRESQLKKLRDELSRKQSIFDNIEKEFQGLRNQLAVIPGMDEDHLENYSSLYYFFTHIKKWKEHRDNVRAKEENLENAKEEKEAILKKINDLLTQFNQSIATEYADAKAKADNLEDQKNEFERLQRAIADSEKEMKRAEAQKEEAGQKLNSIYDRLSMASQDKYVVKDLVDQLSDYDKALNDFKTAEKIVNEVESKLEDHSLYAEKEEEVKTLSSEDLKQRLESNREQANKLEGISREITEIETKINSVKQEHRLEEALSKKEETLQSLQSRYRENAASISGHLLATQLKAQLSERNMPEVFTKAKKLFSRITKGRYTLKVSGKQEAGFRAIDSVDGIGRSLDELSTGTKIQLLLSVRLAFIEQSEGDIKLPILADELLANSDSARAIAIIEALTELSRDGRQIFYFTAQEDEVAKWKTHLRQADDLEIKTFIIRQPGEEYQEMDLAAGQAFPGPAIIREVPKAEGHNHNTYGEVLHVPTFRILRDPVGKLHLWYLLEDVNLLYNALNSGVTTWGELQAYLKADGRIEGFDQYVLENLRQKASLIKKYMDLRRHGHPRPIDRQALEESGAISDTFIDAVSELLENCDHNPERLLTALRNSEVSGFRTNKMDELEAYLEEKEYLSNEEPYSEKEIRIRLMAAVSHFELKVDEVERVLGRLSS